MSQAYSDAQASAPGCAISTRSTGTPQSLATFWTTNHAPSQSEQLLRVKKVSRGVTAWLASVSSITLTLLNKAQAARAKIGGLPSQNAYQLCAVLIKN
jgi:hypothetical protein